MLGWLIGGSLHTALTGLLWGGAVRMLVLHHVTYSINSLCHFFGRRQFETKDESRNLLWLAIPSFGESWHNNHHAFPTSAEHGMRRWQIDTSAMVIRALEKLGPRLGRRARQPRAAGEARRVLSTAPLREALEGALPDRPFRVELWDGTALPSTERRPDVHRCARRRRSATCCARRASSASAART